ncbi:MAG: nitroreductase [Deltaproteobacteria bacterium]|nr:MAG: nitroreductase [Deltaproteobacteria bacterium]
MFHLPPPRKRGEVSLEEAITRRRTVRSFLPDAVDLSELSQLLWSTNGLVDPSGRRAIPSAGALYPLEVYVAVGREGVKGLEVGVYRYVVEDHALLRTLDRDVRKALAQASLWQMWMAEAPITFALCAEYKRTTVKYRERGLRYVMMEVGHAAQNLFLQAVCLGLGAGIVGAFYDEEVKSVLSLPEDHEPLLLMPVGHPA